MILNVVTKLQKHQANKQKCLETHSQNEKDECKIHVLKMIQALFILGWAIYDSENIPFKSSFNFRINNIDNKNFLLGEINT